VRLRSIIRKYFTIFSALTIVSCGSEAVTTHVTEHPLTDPQPYVIGADDVLDIIVWNQSQLGGKIRVADDGTITVPLAGQVPASGLTCEALEKSLHKKLADFTDDPNVTVRVAEPNSKIFYVVGEVRKPGGFQLRSGEVLSQALAEAGGLSDFADASAIRIVRRAPTKNVEMTINYKKVEDGDLSADVPLETGDTITVH
jgi:polysaccharide export outer membrane protein